MRFDQGFVGWGHRVRMEGVEVRVCVRVRVRGPPPPPPPPPTGVCWYGGVGGGWWSPPPKAPSHFMFRMTMGLSFHVSKSLA